MAGVEVSGAEMAGVEAVGVEMLGVKVAEVVIGVVGVVRVAGDDGMMAEFTVVVVAAELRLPGAAPRTGGGGGVTGGRGGRGRREGGRDIPVGVSMSACDVDPRHLAAERGREGGHDLDRRRPHSHPLTSRFEEGGGEERGKGIGGGGRNGVESRYVILSFKGPLGMLLLFFTLLRSSLSRISNI